MAKVKIQGHASGTGVLTVTAPNTSTDRTITLPDSTGTLLTADGDGSSLTGVGVAGISSSADATAITIDSSENVLIGKTTYVGGSGVTGIDIRPSGMINIAREGDTLMYMNRKNSDGDIVEFRKDGTTKGSIGVNSSGAYITLGGTGASNTLDDYEEGTHTVTTTCSTSGSVTLSSTNNKFTYTKIGNLVTITGRLDVSAISSPNGDLSFSLPFAVAQTGSSQNQSTAGAMFVWYPTSGDSGKWVAWADGGESVVYVRHGDGVQPPQSANLARVSTEFRLNFSYTTA